MAEDLSEAAWQPMPDLTTPRYGLNKGYGYVAGGKVYAIGGSVGGKGFLSFEPTASMEVLDVAALAAV